MKHTTAVIFVEPGKAVLDEVPLPEMEDEDVLIETEYSSISVGTERWCLLGKIEGLEPRFPHVPGYQVSGRVIDKGKNVTGFNVGDRVFSITCKPPSGWKGNWWGGQVGHHVKHYSNVIKLPDSVDMLDASGLALAQVGYNGATKPKIRKGDDVLIIGDGLVGQYAGQVFRHLGCNVIMTGHHDYRLDTAIKHGCTDEVINSKGKDILKMMTERFPSGIPVVVETASKSELVQIAIKLTIYCGQVVVLGYYPKEECMIDIHWTRARETTVYFPNSITMERLYASLGLMEKGALKHKELVTHTFKISDAPKAYQMLIDRNTQFLGVALKWK